MYSNYIILTIKVFEKKMINHNISNYLLKFTKFFDIKIIFQDPNIIHPQEHLQYILVYELFIIILWVL